MKNISELTIKCALPELASLAWTAFEEQGLTHKVRSHSKLDNGIAAAIDNMENFINEMMRNTIDNLSALSANRDDKGATWLNANQTK